MEFSIFAVIFVFGILVLIHELGHFIAAKLMGVRVERFSIGFPPRLFGKKVGDTDYCISAIPLGGYVKMSGMIDESMDTDSTGADYEFNSKPVWQRMIIIIAGVVMNFFLAIFILTILNYSNGERYHPYTEIGAIGRNSVTEKIGFQVGDKILAINETPVDSWEQINHQFVQNWNNDIRFLIESNGERQILTYEKEWFREKNAEILSLDFLAPSIVGDVIPGMPASELGLKKGDEIYELDRKSVQNWTQMTEIISTHAGDSIEIKWKRENRDFTAMITPEAIEFSDTLGNASFVGKIGIGRYYEVSEISFVRAIIKGFTDTFGLIQINMRGLWWVISGTKSASDIIGGPIMIAKMAGDAAAAGWESLWIFIAALSAILAFFNILPIPALDGGHLLFLIVEFISRKPVSVKTRLVVQQIGMAILLTLIVFIIYIDLKRLL
jgi:regulator of sigma E protease